MELEMQPVKVELAKLELTPDNVLVVSVPMLAAINTPMVDRLEKGIRKLLGEGQRFIIVTDEIKFTVLARSDVPAADREDENRV